ncbi:hypothetical protein Tco_1019429 [Tanacetum coccineum]|uniref:Uncharacterized protein n=1 Tax=Tanacetum coccineum TaxID=301880 RepID=A0ABQ5FXK5_9ASTR
MEASKTRTTLLSDYTSPLSPDHPLTQTSPTPTLSRPCYYRSTTCMTMRTHPTLSPGILTRVTKAMDLSSLSFYKRYRPSCETPTPSSSPPVMSPAIPSRKRYQGTSELIADINTKSKDLEDESVNSKSEDTVSEDQQQEVPVEGTIVDEPLGLGYRAARRHQHVADPTPRLPVRPTWVDPEDGTAYLDIEFDPQSRGLVQTPSSPEWSSGSLHVSPASLTMPSPVPTPVTTLVATIAVDVDEFLEDITELLDRSGAVKDEVHSLRFRLRSLEQGRERATITFGA